MEWYLVYVDAANGEVVNLVDFTAKASVRDFPYNDLPRSIIVMVVSGYSFYLSRPQ
jgi:hypothetical protein